MMEVVFTILIVLFAMIAGLAIGYDIGVRDIERRWAEAADLALKDGASNGADSEAHH